jgi:hypothetical protein
VSVIFTIVGVWVVMGKLKHRQNFLEQKIDEWKTQDGFLGIFSTFYGFFLHF